MAKLRGLVQRGKCVAALPVAGHLEQPQVASSPGEMQTAKIWQLRPVVLGRAASRAPLPPGRPHAPCRDGVLNDRLRIADFEKQPCGRPAQGLGAEVGVLGDSSSTQRYGTWFADTALRLLSR